MLARMLFCHCSIAIADACFPYSQQEGARHTGLHGTTIS